MTRKKISIGFSPCPNDTFIFDALVNGRIDTGMFEFTPVLEDVEQLNLMASEGKLDVTKISVGAYPEVSGNYIILESGGALGVGVGPVLVARDSRVDTDDTNLKVAIPGIHTTANLLLSVFYPRLQNKMPVLFSDIEQMVLDKKVDAGLLIHEGRFTYEAKGLVKLADLGESWEDRMHTPLPLGAICARRDLDPVQLHQLSEMIRESIRFAYANPAKGKNYIEQHAAEMDAEVIQKHIALYVNEFSIALGDAGRDAIRFLFKKGFENGLLAEVKFPVFNMDLI